MNALVDAPIWSLAVRRRLETLGEIDRKLVQEWRRLVQERLVLIIGMTRQEVLSGIRLDSQFGCVRERLRPFPDEPVLPEDYESAALCYNRCRARGVQGSAVDMLLCAVALRLNAPIFTADQDFAAYGRILPLRLHTAR